MPDQQDGIGLGQLPYTLPAENSAQIGPAPRPQRLCLAGAFDLFWGTYSALGNINDTATVRWTASSDVRQMAENYAYFIPITGSKKPAGRWAGSRLRLRAGIPRQPGIIHQQSQIIKPEMYFVCESLDGGNIAYAPGRADSTRS
jgi:hypothetical protein